jgi:hypothetical protein
MAIVAIPESGWENLGNVTISSDGRFIARNTGGTNQCGPDTIAAGNSGAATRSQDLLLSSDWELRATLARLGGNGRSWFGLTSATPSLNFATWEFCFAINGPVLTNTTPPHPAGTIFIYEGSTTPVAWADGAWTNTGQQIRIVNFGGFVYYYLDCTKIYRSLRNPTASLEAVAVLGCHNMQFENVEIVVGPGIGIGSGAIAEGASAGSGCTAAWTLPTPSALPQPPTVGAPVPVRFQEVTPNWETYTTKFADNTQRANTQLRQQIRMFEVEWDGLSEANAQMLDAHYDSTGGGLSFSIVYPHTGETVTGCRYASYTRSPHTRYWSQTRTATIIRYTA